MKIAILTQPLLLNNYGCILQAYALQSILKEQGHEVDTDLYRAYKKSPIIIKIASCLKHSTKKIFVNDKFYTCNNFNIYAHHNKRTKREIIIAKNIDYFINKYITTIDLFKGKSTPNKNDIEKYDAFIVGSDQVWRATNGYMPAYFLDFTRGYNVKRIAFAASFGVDNWSEYTVDDTNKCAELAKIFDAISVRESTGIELCKNHLGVNAVQVLDPTMLLTKKDYLLLIDEKDQKQQNGILLCYILDNAKEKDEIVNTIAKHFSKEPVNIKPRNKLTDLNVNIEDCIFPSVSKWISSFRDAEFVVTDSFHGLVFSIIFNKPFVVVINYKRGADRFYSLLKLLGLENRMINSIKDLKLDHYNEIDYNYINGIILSLRESALSFIKTNLK